MSQNSDAVVSLAALIASAASDNASKTSTLIGFKDESDTSLGDAVTTLQTASDALKATGTALDNAIAAHTGAASTGGTGPSSITVTVSAPVAGQSSSVPVSGATSDPVVGSAVAGDAIAGGTTVAPGSTASTIVLSQPTTADHTGDGTETLTITAPAAS
jgi:hypothetical protein